MNPFRHLVGNIARAHRPVLRPITFNSRCYAKHAGNNGDISSCYITLGVSPDSEHDEVRTAFLKLAKEYHPDSTLDTADATKFNQVEEAYRKIVAEKKKQEKLSTAEAEEEELMIFDIRHTAPQHRQYLSNEGIGFGTPSQRQKQYQQYRVARASENVFEYKQEKLAAESEENALVAKDKRSTKRNTTRSKGNYISGRLDPMRYDDLRAEDTSRMTSQQMHINRLVEEQILAHMATGQFDNLKGAGRPLRKDKKHSVVDTDTEHLNKLLANSGHAPEWVELQMQISKLVKEVRYDLQKLYNEIRPEPFTPANQIRWESHVIKCRHQIDTINDHVTKYNMLVPALHMQLVMYDINREIERLKNSDRTSGTCL